MNSYPILYHAHHTRHVEDIPFWQSLAQRQGSPVLELGCGTGRVLIALAQAGFRMVGIDRDAAMLSFLRQQITPELARRIDVFEADFSHFRLEERFSLILLPCNTLSIVAANVRQSTMEAASRHLSPGGVFAFSVPNPSFLRKLPRHVEPEVEETFPHPVDGNPVQVSNSWKRSYQHFNLSWHYDHLLPDGRVERTSAHVKHNLVPLEAYLDELRAAGFSTIDLLGDFDRSAYRSDSPYLIVTAAMNG